MLKEIAHTYREKFGRHLPVTSLVRTDEYQRQLNAVNPNATLIETAPHTTGLAFDIYYHFMSKAEQEFVMSDLARLEDSGRVEALRELRDHFHVFAFAEGHPPDEKLVQQQIKRGERRNGEPDAQSGKGTKKEESAAKTAGNEKGKRGVKGKRDANAARAAQTTRAAKRRRPSRAAR
jgi:hypothetical protein